MRYLLLVILVFLLTATASVVCVNFGIFNSQIEAMIHEKSGAKVKLGTLTIAPGWPLRLTSQSGSFENDAVALRWGGLRIDLASVTAPYAIKVELMDPIVTLKTAKSPPPASANPSESAAKVQLPPALNLQVAVSNGEFQSDSVHVTGLDLAFTQPQLLRSASQVHIKAFVESSRLPVKVPFNLDSENLTLTMDAIKSSQIQVNVGGLKANAQGTSLLNEGRHRWIVTLSAPDLAKLPQAPLEMAASDWKGAIQIKLELIKDTAKPWSVQGEASAKDVSATLHLRHEKLAAQGPFHLDLESKFQYINEHPSIESLTGVLDMRETRVVYQDLLQKVSGEQLRISVQAQGDENHLQIKNLDATLWKFNLKVDGQTELSAPFSGEMHVQLLPVSLAGADQVVLALGSMPVTGEAALNARINGPLGDPLKAHIRVEALMLKDFAAHVSFDRPGVLKAVGPVKLSLDGRAEFDHSEVKSADVKGNISLSDAAVIAGPLRKEHEQKFAMVFQAHNAQKSLEIQNLLVDSFFGQMKVKGRVASPAEPTAQGLKIDVTRLDLATLRLALPDWHELIPKGMVDAQITLNGKIKREEAWFAWPVDVSGNVHVNLPEYTMPTAASVDESPAGPGSPAPKPSTGFLPKGYLTTHAKVQVQTNIDAFKKDDLVVKGISSAGQVGGGHFRGKVDVSEVFSGSVHVSGLDVPLVDPLPAVQGNLKWQDIVIEKALAFAKSDDKDFATGKTAGAMDFMTQVPFSLKEVKARGQLQMNPMTLNTVKIGQMINDLAKQLPMVKMSPAKVEPFQGSAKCTFDLKNQILQIQNLQAQDLDNSELQLKGKVALPAVQGDLIGTFAWAKPTVQGCLLEGNSDAQGRMLIPLSIQGDLMHPGLSSLSDLVSKLGSKALNCEQKKLVERLKQDGGKQLGDEVKKRLKGILGN